MRAMRIMCSVCIRIVVHSVHRTLVVIPTIMPIWATDNRAACCTDAITFELFIFSRRRYIHRTHSWDENVLTIAEPSSIAVTITSIDLASMATIRMDDSIFGPQTVIRIVGIACWRRKIARWVVEHIFRFYFILFEIGMYWHWVLYTNRLWLQNTY